MEDTISKNLMSKAEPMLRRLGDKTNDTNIQINQMKDSLKTENNEDEKPIKKKKKEAREATGAASAGQYSGPLFGEPTSKEIINPNGGKVPEIREDNGFNPPKLTMFSDEAKQYKLKNEEVILYCRSGNRSGQAALILDSLGFKQTKNLVGGMLLWEEQFGRKK